MQTQSTLRDIRCYQSFDEQKSAEIIDIEIEIAQISKDLSDLRQPEVVARLTDDYWRRSSLVSYLDIDNPQVIEGAFNDIRHIRRRLENRLHIAQLLLGYAKKWQKGGPSPLEMLYKHHLDLTRARPDILS